MDIFSLTTITLFLFVIIGSYLLFTNSIEGRAKMVLIVVVLIVFIYIFINLPIFNSYTESVSSPQDASKETIMTTYDYTATSYSLSTWIYINDWSSKLGQTKFICKRSFTTPNALEHNPSIALDTNQNNLIIKFHTNSNATSQSPSELKTITIPNISIQKWVNIVTCFGDNKVDTYINGKLTNTHVTNFPQYVPILPTPPPIVWTPAGNSYTGYISNSRYYARFLSPQEVWEIYKGGFSNNMLGNYLNQYNAAFVFSKNQMPIQTINLM
jgi:hypothetical protein